MSAVWVCLGLALIRISCGVFLLSRGHWSAYCDAIIAVNEDGDVLVNWTAIEHQLSPFTTPKMCSFDCLVGGFWPTINVGGVHQLPEVIRQFGSNLTSI